MSYRRKPVIVNKKYYPIPDYEIPLSLEQIKNISITFGESEKPFDICAIKASEVFNARRNKLNEKMQNKIHIVKPETHWFKITQEITRDSNAAFVGKLQVFARTHIEVPDYED